MQATTVASEAQLSKSCNICGIADEIHVQLSYLPKRMDMVLTVCTNIIKILQQYTLVQQGGFLNNPLLMKFLLHSFQVIAIWVSISVGIDKYKMKK